MNRSKVILPILTLGLTMGLSACGGGSGGTTTAGSTSSGVVTAFGSVYVNGVEYETTDTHIEVEEQPASESDLSVGDVVIVQGTVNSDGMTGSATSISSTDEIEGIVVDVSGLAADGTGVLNIMEQNVTINTMTVFESDVTAIVTISDLVQGNIVEVKGFTSGNGNILATRIEVKSVNLADYLTTHSEGIELKGLVFNLNTTTFEIGGLTIDYSAVDVSNVTLSEDLLVEVKSTEGIHATSGHLIASYIEIEDDGVIGHQGEENEDFEMSGVLTSVVDANNTFVINDQTVIIDDKTEYEDRITLADISDAANIGNLYVEVEGKFNSNNQLVAHSIDYVESTESEFKGTLVSITATDVNIGTITITVTEASDASLIGTSTTINVNNNTMMNDDSSDAATGHFNLNNWLSGTYTDSYIGDIIEVDTFIDTTTNDIIALKIEKEDS